MAQPGIGEGDSVNVLESIMQWRFRGIGHLDGDLYSSGGMT